MAHEMYVWALICKGFGFKFGLNTTEHIIGPRDPTRGPSKGRLIKSMTAREAVRRYGELLENYEADSRQCWFHAIEERKLPFYGMPLSPELDQAFPSAVIEMVEANTCYALDRNTACVFHTRKQGVYDQDQALSLRTRVHECLSRISKYVREDGPKINKRTFRVRA